MNVIFTTPTDTVGASSRYRVYQYLEYLPEKIHYKVFPFMSNSDYRSFKNDRKIKLILKFPFLYITRFKLLFLCKKGDVVFVHRDIEPFGPMILEKLLKLKGCKLILDIDDAVYEKNIDEISNKRNKFLYKLKYGKRFDSAIKNADLVICGNQFLHDYSLNYNKNSIIIPTVIDTAKIKAKKVYKSDFKEITIGWIGNPGNTKYVTNILEQIDQYFIDNINVKGHLILIGAKRFDTSKYKIKITFKDWSILTEYELLRSCDFGLMPLLDSEWSKGKCGAKILQYFAAGIPALCSGVGVNSELVTNGVTGYIVKENNWYDGIDYFMKHTNEIELMGKNGRKLVEENYSIKSQIDKYIKCLDRN